VAKDSKEESSEKRVGKGHHGGLRETVPHYQKRYCGQGGFQSFKGMRVKRGRLER